VAHLRIIRRFSFQCAGKNFGYDSTCTKARRCFSRIVQLLKGCFHSTL